MKATPPNEKQNARTEKKSGLRAFFHRLKRILILTFYLPALILTRQVMLRLHIHGQARHVHITAAELPVDSLPEALDGLRIVFLTDLHCSPLTPPAFLQEVICAANHLAPDLILLGGDYISKGSAYVEPLAQLLAQLNAPLGKFGVLGNHDYETDVEAVRGALARAGVVELSNRSCRVWYRGAPLTIAGVSDFWEDVPEIETALRGVDSTETVILLSHNPDYAMELNDTRVDIVLSGHTHGGQIHLPRYGPLFTNSRYGRKLVSGMVRFPSFVLYVSRGIGSVALPFRHKCPPEISLLTLCRANPSAQN